MPNPKGPVTTNGNVTQDISIDDVLQDIDRSSKGKLTCVDELKRCDGSLQEGVAIYDQLKRERMDFKASRGRLPQVVEADVEASSSCYMCQAIHGQPRGYRQLGEKVADVMDASAPQGELLDSVGSALLARPSSSRPRLSLIRSQGLTPVPPPDDPIDSLFVEDQTDGVELPAHTVMLPSAPSMAESATACFRFRHVLVHKLLDDGTLGLLLNGTCVVGFCGTHAEECGWQIGDHIVEVESMRVGSFDEFLEQFVAAQAVGGLPIDFSVLRREGVGMEAAEDAQNTLDDFFGALDFADLTGKLQGKPRGRDGQRESKRLALGRTSSVEGAGLLLTKSITENPYILALRRRRDELLVGSEGWQAGMSNPASLASRMATERDGVATLTKPSRKGDTSFGTPRVAERPPEAAPRSPCSWFVGAIAGHDEEPSLEVCSTPRVDWSEAYWHRQAASTDETAIFQEYATGVAMTTATVDPQTGLEFVVARKMPRNFGARLLKR